MANDTDINHCRNGQIMKKVAHNSIFPFSRCSAQGIKINVESFKTENVVLAQKLVV